MTDVFISYAHEDQPFVARMARAFEDEGLSVWWDHTIPPGRTWETFIARGITEARCCIVVWSGHSVASDWVKEEATLAKDGGKYLPVAISDEQPPMGFRRIQAAQLKNWNGDRANAQWQLLVGEVRALVGGAATPAPRIPEPRSSHPPPLQPPTASPGKSPNWTLIGGIGAAAITAIALFVGLNVSRRDDAATPTVEAPMTDQAPAEDLAASFDPAELERMRNERDAAIEREREQRVENERLRNLSAPNVAVPTTLQPADVLGVWRVIGGSGCAGDQRFVLHGSNMSWDWLNGETWSENSQSNGPYVLDANSLYINGRKILERRDDGFWIVSSGPGGTYNCHVAR